MYLLITGIYTRKGTLKRVPSLNVLKLSEFERQSLEGLRKAVREVYREAMRNNQKVVVGDYKGNPRLIDPSEAFKKTTHRRRILKKLRSIVTQKDKY
jgi:acyl-[acyl carrier protein]--UDP-N-acetylglucosamine O-acyltransferase